MYTIRIPIEEVELNICAWVMGPINPRLYLILDRFDQKFKEKKEILIKDFSLEDINDIDYISDFVWPRFEDDAKYTFVFSVKNDGIYSWDSGDKNNRVIFKAWISLYPTRLKYICEYFLSEYNASYNEIQGKLLKEQLV